MCVNPENFDWRRIQACAIFFGDSAVGCDRLRWRNP